MTPPRIWGKNHSAFQNLVLNEGSKHGTFILELEALLVLPGLNFENQEKAKKKKKLQTNCGACCEAFRPSTVRGNSELPILIKDEK